MGTDKNGNTYMYFLIFLIVGVNVVVDADRILRKLTNPPIRGSIPYGSGELKSLNHKNPSVRIAGLVS
jgi:hypothetical protein